MTETPLPLPRPADLLPHAPPFLLVDRCLSCAAEEAVCEVTFSAEMPLLQGHFPGEPIVPGVLLLEALAQTLAYHARFHDPGCRLLLAGVDKARFRRPVLPEQPVRLHIRLERQLMGLAHVRAEASVEGELVCEARLKGHITPSGGAAPSGRGVGDG